MKTVQFRMTMNTYRRIRHNFRALHGETAAQYFKRLSRFLEETRLSYEAADVNEYVNSKS